jgi:hypothetical protein
MMNTTGCSSGVSVCVRDGLAGWAGGIRTSAFRNRNSPRLQPGAAGFEPPYSGIEIRQDSSLGLRDSNLCILKLDLLNFSSPQRDVGIDRAPERFVRSAARFEMRKFESWPPG